MTEAGSFCSAFTCCLPQPRLRRAATTLSPGSEQAVRSLRCCSAPEARGAHQHLLQNWFSTRDYCSVPSAHLAGWRFTSHRGKEPSNETILGACCWDLKNEIPSTSNSRYSCRHFFSSVLTGTNLCYKNSNRCWEFSSFEIFSFKKIKKKLIQELFL